MQGCELEEGGEGAGATAVLGMARVEGAGATAVVGSRGGIQHLKGQGANAACARKSCSSVSVVVWGAGGGGGVPGYDSCYAHGDAAGAADVGACAAEAAALAILLLLLRNV